MHHKILIDMFKLLLINLHTTENNASKIFMQERVTSVNIVQGATYFKFVHIHY